MDKIITNNKLKILLIKYSGIDDEIITDDTKLTEDLGMNGDDAIDFIFAYSKDFNVYVSNFMAADYFDAEGDQIFPRIIRFLTGKKKNNVNKELKVADLFNGILAGRLDDRIINNG